MTRKIVDAIITESGAFVAKPTEDTSIDDLMKAGIQSIRGIMKAISTDISTGAPGRETVQNLKDVMNMLHELKKKEQELLDNMSDEQLEEHIKSK